MHCVQRMNKNVRQTCFKRNQRYMNGCVSSSRDCTNFSYMLRWHIHGQAAQKQKNPPPPKKKTQQNKTKSTEINQEPCISIGYDIRTGLEHQMAFTVKRVWKGKGGKEGGGGGRGLLRVVEKQSEGCDGRRKTTSQHRLLQTSFRLMAYSTTTGLEYQELSNAGEQQDWSTRS